MTDDAAPVARIRPAAIAANVAELAAGSDAVVDLRRDAYGHGVIRAIDALADSGVRMLVDDLSVVDGDRVVRDAVPTLSPGAVFGWADGAAAMTLIGTVLGTKGLRAGEGVSYGYRHRAERDTRIALVTGGYAQGVPRSLGGAATVVLGGAAHPIVGRVAMDVCVVDIGGADIVRGDEAVFFGLGGVRLSAWQDATGWGGAELATTVGLRTRREYLP